MRKRGRVEGRLSNFFLIHLNLGDEVYFKGGRFVTPYFRKGIKLQKLSI
jgi:hypothetical protein